MNKITSTMLEILDSKRVNWRQTCFQFRTASGSSQSSTLWVHHVELHWAQHLKGSRPSKPWLKLFGHQSSILSKAGDCMLRCIICTLPIYWSIIYLSLYYTHRYMYAYTCIKKLCTMCMIDNIMYLLFSITIY